MTKPEIPQPKQITIEDLRNKLIDQQLVIDQQTAYIRDLLEYIRKECGDTVQDSTTS